MRFISFAEDKINLHFQCSTNMTLEQICKNVNTYILDRKSELYANKTDMPVQLKRFVLVRDDTLWDK